MIMVALNFATKLNSRDIQKNVIVLGTLLCSVRLCSLSSISCATGDRSSQIEKRVLVSMRRNLPQKISKVFYEPKFGPTPPPQLKIPGSAPVYVTWFLLLLLLIIIINLLYLRKFIYSSKSFEPIMIKNISVYKIIVYYVWIVVWWKQRQKHHCLPNIKPANQSALCQDTSGGLVRSHIDENGTLRLFRYFFKKTASGLFISRPSHHNGIPSHIQSRNPNCSEYCRAQLQLKFLKSPALIRLLIRQNIRGDKKLGRLSS